MRVILLLLAAYAFVGWNDANAACQRFKPDGSVEACQHMAPGAAPVTPNPNQASANPCELGGMLAYRAYMWAVPDAVAPDYKRLHYGVDYWGDMLILKHDRAVAHRAVDYIAARLKPTGMRQPWEGAVYEAVREFIVKECNK